mgnify:CR=1 FL=1
MSCLLEQVYPICLMSKLDPNEVYMGRLIGTAVSLLLAAIVYAPLLLTFYL